MARASDQAYDALRRAILQSEYAVGERLREAAIADDLGISRTPVREALRRLDADGLVEVRANRGAVVTRSIDRELSETYALRALLEGLGVSLAAQRITDTQLEGLRRLCEKMEQAADSGDHAGYPVLNVEFHKAIVAASGSERLERQLGSLIQSSLVSSAYHRLPREHITRSLNHHREIVAALEYRNPDWAEAIMRAHIYAAWATIKARREDLREHD